MESAERDADMAEATPADATSVGVAEMEVDLPAQQLHPIGEETVSEAVLTDAVEEQVLTSSKLLASADQLVPDEAGWPEVAEHALPENAGHMSVSLQRDADGVLAGGGNETDQGEVQELPAELASSLLSVADPPPPPEAKADPLEVKADHPLPTEAKADPQEAKAEPPDPLETKADPPLPPEAKAEPSLFPEAAPDPPHLPEAKAEPPETEADPPNPPEVKAEPPLLPEAKVDPPVRVQRAQRQLKRKRDAEFLYEGDEDWETMIERGKAGHRRNLLGGVAVAGIKGQHVDADPGLFAAVTAGLKAKALLPSELIRFKDQLKKRAGKEDYLAARNLVLALWGKDTSRVLQLTDCKVTPTPTPGESSGAPLIREVFEFLDQRGFINTGVAGSKRAQVKKMGSSLEQAEPPLKREEALPDAMTVDFLEAEDEPESKEKEVIELVKIKTEGGVDLATVKEQGKEPKQEEDATSAEAEQVAVASEAKADSSEAKADASEAKGDASEAPKIQAPEDIAPEAKVDPPQRKVVSDKEVIRGLRALLRVADLQTMTERQLRKQLESNLGADLSDRKSLLRTHVTAFLKTGQVDDDTDDEGLGLKRVKHVESGVKEEARENGGGKKAKKEDATRKRRKVVVVGAGPAGLTAARHMQRLGLEVIVLEARKRVGGRVHTDKKSFSAPVDLGASIITGVEADVIGERQPDPSAVVCKQLGIEHVPLGPLCPLYDVVTGQLITPAVDQAIEAEFNALLDDTALLPAEKPEVASMSLEEGLEAALLSRRQKAAANSSSKSALPPEKMDVDTALPEQKPSGDSMDIDTSVGASDVEAKVSTEASLAVDTHPTEGVKSVQDTEVAQTGNGLEADAFITPEERRALDWHYANLEYGCAAQLGLVSLPHWNQDDPFGGFGGPHCMVKGGYGPVIEALAEDLDVRLGSVVSEISYGPSTSSGSASDAQLTTVTGETFSCDAVLLTAPLGCLKAGDFQFSPPLPVWKQEAIQRLGYGNLNKALLQFHECFWDESVDYFGATAEDGHDRGNCFMFWNLKRVCGEPILLALIVGEAAQAAESQPDAVVIEHAVATLRRIFGAEKVPEPSTARVTHWGSDRYSRGAYSYIAVGATGKDYDLMAAPVEKTVFFAGEATCREHPDTVGGAMLSGLREAIRIAHILEKNHDIIAEEASLISARKTADDSKLEIRDIVHRVEQVSDAERVSVLESLMASAKTPGGRSTLANKLLQLQDRELRGFAGTRSGLKVLNGWVTDALAADTSGTQLLRSALRILFVAAVDLNGVKVSGVAKTIREQALAHPSREIRVLAKDLVNRWIAIFKRQKAQRLLHQRSSSPKQLSPPATENGGVKAEEKEGEETEKPLSEAELALKKAAEEAEAAALAAEEALKAAQERLSSSIPALPEIVSFSKYAKKDKRPDEKRASHERVQAEERKSSSQTASPAERKVSPDESQPRKKVSPVEKQKSKDRVRDSPADARRHKKERHSKEEKRRLRKEGSDKELKTAKEGRTSNGSLLKRSENGKAEVPLLSATWQNKPPQEGENAVGGTAVQQTQPPRSAEPATGVPRVENNADVISRPPVEEEEYDPFGENDVMPAEDGVIEASALLAAAQQPLEGGQSAGQMNPLPAIDIAASQPGLQDASLQDQQPEIASQPALASASEVPNAQQVNETGGSGVIYEYDPAQTWDAAEKERRRQEAASASGAKDRKQAVQDIVISVLKPVYNSKGISKEDFKTILKKASAKVLERQTAAEKLLTNKEFLTSKRESKIEALVEGYVEKYQAAASQKGRKR